MNKIRTKASTAYLLVDTDGNFSEITHAAFVKLWADTDMCCEYLRVDRGEQTIVSNDKTGNIVYTSEWSDCTIAQGIDGYFTDSFTNDALHELQRRIQKGQLEDINIIFAK